MSTRHRSNSTGNAHAAEHQQRQKDSTSWPYDLFDVSNDFVVQVQAVSRTYLAKRNFAYSRSVRLSYASSAPSLACLTRDMRYARAEAALRVALSRCETEPSPLELQVRVMEKGLQSWNARVGRGYERLKKAEEALAAARQERGLTHSELRGSMSELQREKWMGIKERDEALAMVEKIKSLIVELNTDIKGGVKMPTNPKTADPPHARASNRSSKASTVDDAGSKKVPILFTGRFPPPYLENLPRCRRSVEPLRLSPGQIQFANTRRRQRSLTLPAEPVPNMLSTPSTTQPSSSPPSTPIGTFDGFGAVFIHTPLPPKSTAQYLAEMAEAEGQTLKRTLGHTRLPSYVGNLMDEFSEDKIGSEKLDLGLDNAASPSPPNTPVPRKGAVRSPAPTPSASTPLKRYSRAFLGRPFNTPSSVSSLSPSSVQNMSSEEHHDFFPTLHGTESAAAFEKLLQTFSHTASTSSPPSSTPGSSARNSGLLAPARIPQLRKRPSRIGHMVDNMRKGVKRVTRKGD